MWCATIGKFVNIAAAVRINATNHPTWRPTLHHFTYRASDYWDDAEHEQEFFDMRRSKRVTVGHDTWLGHGSTILPGVTVGDGAAVGAGAVVSKDVTGPAHHRRRRARKTNPRTLRPQDRRTLPGAGLVGLGPRQLRAALDDFRHLSAEAFLEKHGGRGRFAGAAPHLPAGILSP